jgi:hypothetical protein
LSLRDPAPLRMKNIMALRGGLLVLLVTRQ